MTNDTSFFSADIWRPALDKYGAVTHLTVGLYDIDEHIVLGPAPPSPLFAVFEKYEHHPGIFLECARKCLSQPAHRPEVVVVPSYGLGIVGTPLVLRGAIVGAAVAGYVLLDFLQSSAIEGLARSAHIPFRILSEIARQLQPVPQRRLFLYGELLQVLGDSILRENDRTRQYENVAARLKSEAEALHKSEQALLEQTEMLEIFVQTAKVVAAEIDMRKLVQAVTDVGTSVTGAQFGAFFLNEKNSKGEFQKPYTISGLSSEEFAHVDLLHHTELFDQLFRGEGVLRIDGARQNTEYRNAVRDDGMPSNRLSVSSYLAAPVVSRSGAVLGGLFFGHSQSDVFHERHERILEGFAAQAAVAMDNAQLYEIAIQAQDKAEAADRSKDQFLAMVSHELRTPLSAILGWSHILADQTKSEMASKARKIIERNANAQAQLIDDLLDMSRITTGKLRLDFRPIELLSIIEAARDVVQPVASAKAIDLRVRFDTEFAQVTGDAERLQQVVGNMLSNAVKFTSPGGWVEVRLQRSDPDMEIVVSDNGKGIKAEFLPYLFDRFVQADTTITRRYSGLGLGLAIVRHLVELHGGTVTAESEGEGQGAKFTVRLPIRAVRATISDSEHEPQRPSASRDLNVPVQLEGVRVLVVDDQADARDLLATVLEQSGVQVTLASSAAEALARLSDATGKEDRPDVLISDIAMPGEDGYTLIHKVRNLGPERGGDLPAIALTAHTRTEDRSRALAAGFQAHVGKPVDSQELKTVIAGLIGRLSA